MRFVVWSYFPVSVEEDAGEKKKKKKEKKIPPQARCPN